jgi:hypothetical protein
LVGIGGACGCINMLEVADGQVTDSALLSLEHMKDGKPVAAATIEQELRQAHASKDGA